MAIDFNGVLSVLTKVSTEDVIGFLDALEKMLQQAQKTVQETKKAVERALKIRDALTKTAKIIRDMK